MQHLGPGALVSRQSNRGTWKAVSFRVWQGKSLEPFCKKRWNPFAVGVERWV